jgi:hypothetical protein
MNEIEGCRMAAIRHSILENIELDEECASRLNRIAFGHYVLVAIADTALVF